MNDFHIKDFNEDWFAPTISKVQKSLYDRVHNLCLGDPFYDGPWLEHRVSKCSLDMAFIKGLDSLPAVLQKVSYEVDCGIYHDEEYDKRRDNYLLKKHNWHVFRIDVNMIDYYGEDEVAKQVYSHLMYQFGMTKQKNWSDWIITSYQNRDYNNKKPH